MKLVILGGKGDSTNIVVNAILAAGFNPTVVLEERRSRKQLLKARMRRLGVWNVLGQLIFKTLIFPILRKKGAYRAREISERNGFSTEQGFIYTEVLSVNDSSALELFARLKPDLVVINGTRILSGATIRALDCPVINMHAGVTPLYRGGHGGWWALYEGNDTLVGTTVHQVDTGIDTGNVISYHYFAVEPSDNFFTIPLLHLEAGIPGLIDAVSTYEQTKRIEPNSELRQLSGKGKVYYHPTVFQYLKFQLRRAVKK